MTYLSYKPPSVSLADSEVSRAQHQCLYLPPVLTLQIRGPRKDVRSSQSMLRHKHISLRHKILLSLIGEFPFGPVVSFSVFMASILPINVPINVHKDTSDYYSRYSIGRTHCHG